MRERETQEMKRGGRGNRHAHTQWGRVPRIQRLGHSRPPPTHPRKRMRMPKERQTDRQAERERERDLISPIQIMDI